MLTLKNINPKILTLLALVLCSRDILTVNSFVLEMLTLGNINEIVEFGEIM
mgnify:CR=1 FL=1